MKIGVAILTNGDRRKRLEACLKSLIENTDYPDLSVCVFDNGSTDDTSEWLNQQRFEEFKTFRVRSSVDDLGCAAGTNQVSEMVRDYDYVLHLESDFLMLPSFVTGEDKQWLQRALSHLETSGSDYLYLRRMVSPEEARMHWWAQWMPKVKQGTESYMEVPGFWWSNNPHLRRNEGIYAAGCLPLNESRDGPKGTPGWSKPEMTTNRPQKASVCRWGVFVHEQVPKDTTALLSGCNGSPGSDPWCKYGFFGLNGTQDFCKVCDPEKGLGDLPEHDNRFGGKMKQEVQPESEPEIVHEAEIVHEVPDGPPFTVITVDNGWTYAEFERITKPIPKVRRLLVAKGAAGIPSSTNVEVVPFEDLDKAIEQADAALFCKVGDSNREEYKKILEAGVPVVVHVDHQQGLIDHQRNGFIYADESWATLWVTKLYQSEELRAEIKETWEKMGGRRDSMLTYAEVAKGCPSCAEKMKQGNIKAVSRGVVEKELDKKPTKVTVITPTWRRDPKIIRRAVDCMTLQTVADWEQLVCSNGPEEMEARGAVESARDVRVRYRHLDEEQAEGDFGNSARKKMIEEARGEYIMFLDDDNIILPTYIEKMVKCLDGNPSVGFAVCRIIHFGPLKEEAVGKPPAILVGEPVKLHHIDPLQVMVRTELMQKVGWDTEKGYLSDGVTLEKLGDEAEYLLVANMLGVHI